MAGRWLLLLLAVAMARGAIFLPPMHLLRNVIKETVRNKIEDGQKFFASDRCLDMDVKKGGIEMHLVVSVDARNHIHPRMRKLQRPLQAVTTTGFEVKQRVSKLLNSQLFTEAYGNAKSSGQLLVVDQGILSIVVDCLITATTPQPRL